MKKIALLLCCLMIVGCGKRGGLEAEDQVYPRTYPSPLHAEKKEKPCA